MQDTQGGSGGGQQSEEWLQTGPQPPALAEGVHPLGPSQGWAWVGFPKEDSHCLVSHRKAAA